MLQCNCSAVGILEEERPKLVRKRYAKVRKGTQRYAKGTMHNVSDADYLPRKQIKTLSQEVAPTPIRALRQPRKGTQQERKYHALVRSYIFDWRKATEGRSAETVSRMPIT